MKTLLKETTPILQDKGWWGVRAIILARDKDKFIGPKKLEERIKHRRN